MSYETDVTALGVFDGVFNFVGVFEGVFNVLVGVFAFLTGEHNFAGVGIFRLLLLVGVCGI